MTIEQSKYLPEQMNGPVINSQCQAVKEEFSASALIADYLHNLSIASAQESELENIGRLIGYIRPLVPEGFNDENILLLGGLPLVQDDLVGLSSLDSEIGGRLNSISTTNSNYMEIETYRVFLQKIAKLKRYGITLKTVDEIVSAVSKKYTLSFDENHDIKIKFEKSIGYKNTWILTQVFYRIATEPQVLITSGAE